MRRPFSTASSSSLPAVALRLVLLLSAITTNAHGYRILGIFTHIGGSHYHTFYPIMNGLAEHGNNVTVLSYFNAKNPSPNYHERRFQGLNVINSSLPVVPHPSRSFAEMFGEFFALYGMGVETCRDTFNQSVYDEILAEHRREPFDLVVTELFDSDCVLGFIYLMQVPYVGLSSCVLMPWLHDRVSMPDVPSHVPNEFVPYGERMNFVDRFTSWVMTKSLKLMYHWIVGPNDNAMIAERFGAGIPDVRELMNNVSLVLLNTHYSLHGTRPTSPQVVQIGGVHIKKQKPLPDDLQAIMDDAKHGVIVISWGSNIKTSTLDAPRVQAILRAVAQLQQQVIWKWEEGELPNKPANLHIRRWLPQRDMLCHPNVVLFWSHAGNLGLSESAHCGKPVVLTPFYGDQFVNEAAAKYRGMAVSLPFVDINADTVLAALREGIRPEYAANAERISLAFRQRPMSPVDTSVWWIEHVIETAGLPLARSHAMELSWWSYHSVDVIATLAIGLWLVGWLAWRLIRLAVALGRSDDDVKRRKSKKSK